MMDEEEKTMQRWFAQGDCFFQPVPGDSAHMRVWIEDKNAFVVVKRAVFEKYSDMDADRRRARLECMGILVPSKR